MTVSRSLEDRFWTKVEILSPDDCWEWKACKNRGGYGRISLPHKFKKCDSMLSHRTAWIISNGEIPKGMKILHKCDNPSCCNPNHLFLGTQYDNVQDMVRKGRVQHRLSDEQVLEIVHKYSLGDILQKDLAKEYGIHTDYVSSLVCGVKRLYTLNRSK